MNQLILASTSFRRQELLTWLGIPFEIVSPDFEEEAVSFDEIKDVEKFVKTLAIGKLFSVIDTYRDATIVTADTIVYFQGEVYGKPRNLDHAREMLRMLLGNTHQVYSAICFGQPRTGVTKVITEVSSVTFRAATSTELEQYIQTSESLGKAGSYAIQGGAKKFVQRVEGSWTNVLGLPLIPVAKELRALEHDVDVMVDVEEMIYQNLGVRS